MNTKFIFVTGGVVSSLGKGITASSIGQLLKSRGYKIFIQKFDPYINVDPGTMSPMQHGEVFVTDDGAEADLDLGHYERFIDVNLSKDSTITTGKIYSSVIQKERRGEYLGATVQVIPHVTDEIKLRLKQAAANSKADIIITEIGGTVGDIESLPYLEAIRQARRDFGYSNTLYVHNTLIPYLKAANEIKTKPTQHSVKELRSLGIQPDMIVLRSETKISNQVKDKIALFCDVDKNLVFEALDVDILYESIINMNKQNVDDYILKHFNLSSEIKADLSKWHELISNIKSLSTKTTIALVGKYVSLKDAYLSVCEALKHAGYYHKTSIEIKWIDAEKIDESNVSKVLLGIDGIIVPGGFGKRATDGILTAIKYARESKTPFFGICYGMQLAAIEYARNVINIHDANSTEIDKDTKSPLFDIRKQNKDDLGGTLRLGLDTITIKKDSMTHSIYNKEEIKERHRHRYEFNNDYKEIFTTGEMMITGISKKDDLVEIIELQNHPWFIAVQYHPEFISRPLRPHPLFIAFVGEAQKKSMQ